MFKILFIVYPHTEDFKRDIITKYEDQTEWKRTADDTWIYIFATQEARDAYITEGLRKGFGIKIII